ncbi:glutathione S-transferase family protein [Niveibacterium terrae]|uniref:glutathione S-transferase family protein n=1 Tax=Niveibacterium terrae TaxID=3373598 RepID=UPI003A959542
MKLVIANKNYSSWSLRAWLALRATGQSFTEEQVLLGQPDSREQILKHSPSGRVPCLVDGSLLVWDSLAIIEYLAEQFPALWPEDRGERAVARSISAEMHSSFPALRSQMPMNIRRSLPGRGHSAESEADIARIVQIWNRCLARRTVEGPYLFGRFSGADAMFAPVCFRFQTYGVEPTGPAGTYLATMLAHPAMREWQAAAEQETAIVAADELPGQ